MVSSRKANFNRCVHNFIHSVPHIQMSLGGQVSKANMNMNRGNDSDSVPLHVLSICYGLRLELISTFAGKQSALCSCPFFITGRKQLFKSLILTNRKMQRCQYMFSLYDRPEALKSKRKMCTKFASVLHCKEISNNSHISSTMTWVRMIPSAMISAIGLHVVCLHSTNNDIVVACRQPWICFVQFNSMASDHAKVVVLDKI
jgi:hypothetical protein